MYAVIYYNLIIWKKSSDQAAPGQSKWGKFPLAGMTALGGREGSGLKDKTQLVLTFEK